MKKHLRISLGKKNEQIGSFAQRLERKEKKNFVEISGNNRVRGSGGDGHSGLL